MSKVVNQFYRFGDFVVDGGRRLLMKHGTPVPLKPKVFDTLLLLVAHSGTLLEKDYLLQEIWDGEAVEEIGLTKNISVLRKALGETPGEHRFIVTVPGHGYQFVADVTVDADAEEEDSRGTVAVTVPVVPRFASEEDLLAPAADTREHSSVAAYGQSRPAKRMAVALALLVLTGAGLVVLFRGRPLLAEKDTVLLAEFVNRTKDPVFDGTLAQGLAVQLEQSPHLDIFPDARMRHTLRLMGRLADDRVDGTVAREICQRQGLKAYIVGSIAPLGSHYVITLEAADGRDGTTLARTQVEAESKEQVLRTLSQAASQLRQDLGESLPSIQRFDALLESTTTSLQALQAYSLGDAEKRRGRTAEAMSFFRRAIELDPGFATAYARLAVLYRNGRQPGRAAEHISRAYALRERVSEIEKLYITSLYHELVTADMDRNIEALLLFRQIYPRNPVPHSNLAAAYANLGEFEESVQEGKTAMRLDPTSAVRYAVLGNSLLRLNQFEEARSVYGRALEQKFDSLSIRRGLYRLALVDRDAEAMERQLKWASANSNEHAGFDWQARTAAYLGQWRRSAGWVRRAVSGARQGEELELADLYAADSALRGAVLGRCADIALPLPSGGPAGPNAGEPGAASRARWTLALAICGQTAEAQTGVEQLKRQFPENTVLNRIWIPAIQAAVELGRGSADKAVDLLQAASRYESAAEFWPQYLRGQAYLRLNKPAEAIAEFRKILDNRGQDVSSPLYALARFGLGQSLKRKGEAAEARRAAGSFFSEWKDADPDLPVLVAAQKEFATWK